MISGCEVKASEEAALATLFNSSFCKLLISVFCADAEAN
jgi:hypothetical protein